MSDTAYLDAFLAYVEKFPRRLECYAHREAVKVTGLPCLHPITCLIVSGEMGGSLWEYITESPCEKVCKERYERMFHVQHSRDRIWCPVCNTYPFRGVPYDARMG